MDTPVIDLKDLAFKTNPYPFFKRLRDTAPVYWFPHSGETGGMWLITRYDDVVTLLKDDRRITKDLTRLRTPENADRISRDLLSTDPPDHTRLRGLVNLAFTPKRIKDLEARIRQIADELIAAVGKRGEMDFMADFAVPLPIMVIAELLGVPPEDRREFRAWSNDLVRSLDAVSQTEETRKRGEEGGLKLIEYFASLVQQRRAQPKEDLISGLVGARDGDDRLSEKELLDWSGNTFLRGLNSLPVLW